MLEDGLKAFDAREDTKTYARHAREHSIGFEDAALGILKILEDNENGRALMCTTEGLHYHEFQE